MPLLLLSGCLKFMPAPVPMAHVDDPLPDGKAKCLVVLLPGAGDRADTFREEGFIEAIRLSGLSIDVVSADATPGYYFRGVAAGRLETDVIAPARAKGYAQLWVVGISIGGFGALHYTQQYPEHVDGVAAFAPWLGDKQIGEEIRAAGGLAKWSAPAAEPINEANYQRQLWGWLKRVAVEKQPAPLLYLGYGDDDRLGLDDALLAAELPKTHVFHAPGGHDWPPWRRLLKQLLQGSELRGRCAAP